VDRRSTAALFDSRAALSRWHWRHPDQPAPGGRIVVSPRRSPGIARVQDYEPCPQAPHLAPSAERLRLTPLSEPGYLGIVS
jgi:hypothetical protein